jgi:hypothetical protein
MIETLDGIARYSYKAYPHQKLFHESRHKHRLLGGAAGPGKTLALIEDHMMACAMFNLEEAPQVHTLLVRRTHPKLRDTVITRFREKIPRELYRDFNESQGLVTWHNGSTTKFGSMQHESDVWGYQGQWYKIGYDELTEFTFPQWQNISAWNRCPVAEHCTKDGATNPIGIGAMWVEDLFVRQRPCAEMDAGQKATYNKKDYGYFPATYLDNPVYATNKSWIAGLDSYSSAVSQALKMGIWGVAGGYFDGAWDEAENVYPVGSVKLEPWWRRWLGGDWGFDHNSVIHGFCLDDLGIVRIYSELVVNRHTPEMLGNAIVENSKCYTCMGIGLLESGLECPQCRGRKVENYELFSLSHDAFAEKQDVNPIGLRIGAILQKAGLVAPSPSTKDKLGREQILYDYLKGRVKVGQVFNDSTGLSEPITAAKLQIASSCENLIRTIPKAPRDEKNREEIAEFLGDDALQSSGYGLYAMFGKPRQKPLEVRVEERIQSAQITDPTSAMIWAQKFTQEEKKKGMPQRLGGRRKRPLWWR